MGSSYFFQVQPTEEQFAYLETLPVASRRATMERAIHRALDEEGWPRGDRGEMPIPTSYWYVVVFTKRGVLRGHVGPMPDADKAALAERSWRMNNHVANVTRYPLGVCLTNSY